MIELVTDVTERMIAENPGLERAGVSTKSGHAMGAANLRRELNKAFPGVKFRVTSKSYSGGDSISVHWSLGPTSKQVEAIADKYEECYFDGMTDSEHYKRNGWTPVFGGAKYVMCQRDYETSGLGQNWFDKSVYGLIGRALCDKQGVEYVGQSQRRVYGENDDMRDLQQYVNMMLNTTSFPAGWSLADFSGIEWDGNHDTGYRIIIKQQGEVK